MADKRMFSKQITRSDAFLDMPRSTRLLYYDLNLDADDDGFVDKYKSIMRLTGATEDDLKLLIAKAFIIPFDSGIVVIKHWWMNNLIRKDRKKPTVYQEELAQLSIKDNGSYTIDNQMTTNGCRRLDKISIEEIKEREQEEKDGVDNVQQMTNKYQTNITPPYIDTINDINTFPFKEERNKEKIKECIFKEKKRESKKDIPVRRFVKPTIQEIANYCSERKNTVDAETFYDFYESKGWKVGNQPMKDWKACVRTWEQKRKETAKPSVVPNGRNRNYTKEELTNLYDDLDNASNSL